MLKPPACNRQHDEAAGDGQVFHEHQLVYAFRKVSVEQQRGQNGEAGSEQRYGAGQETEQDRQTAAKFQQDGQRQQKPGTPIDCMYCWVPA